ncbi:porin [Pseudoalteromonas sp. T1lg65]|uniref:porin n=1 Tax=Pseudoalteromonas sp. T1lg65 TaxID=2077101 RepID=UPI003F7965F8
MRLIANFTRYLTVLSLFTVSTYGFCQDLKISGFGTVTMGSTLESDKSLGFYNDDVQFKPESLAGIQFYSDISNNTSATIQLTARGQNDFDAEIEWLYLTHIINRNWSVKVGKFRTPFYNFSESLDIGYSYHWIRPPQSVYIPLFNNMEGVNAMYRSVIGEVDSDLQMFYGTLHEQTPGGPVDIDFMAGFSWSLQKDWFSMRTSYFKSKVTIPPVFAGNVLALLPTESIPGSQAMPGPALPTVSMDVANAIIPQGDSATNAGIALKAEFDDWMVLGEYTINKVEDSVFTNPTGYYVSFVYFLGDFQPHFTYENFDTDPQFNILKLIDNNDPVKPLLEKAIGETDEDKKTYTLGVKYNLNSGTVLKLDYSYTDYKTELLDPIRPRVDAGVFSASVSFVF